MEAEAAEFVCLAYALRQYPMVIVYYCIVSEYCRLRTAHHFAILSFERESSTELVQTRRSELR